MITLCTVAATGAFSLVRFKAAAGVWLAIVLYLADTQPLRSREQETKAETTTRPGLRDDRSVFNNCGPTRGTGFMASSAAAPG
jgi:hypothetical protein